MPSQFEPTMDAFEAKIRRFDGAVPAMITPGMLIAGSVVTAESSLEVFNPATGQVIGQCPECDTHQLDKAVSMAQLAFEAWSTTSFETRKNLVLQLAEVLGVHKNRLAEILTLEQGKPTASAIGEISAAQNYCRAFAEMTLSVEIIEDTHSRRVELRRKPIGVVAAITPWNYPILLAFWKIPAALMAGNCVILKPSPLAPLTVLTLGELIRDIFPPGVFNVVSGEAVGPMLTGHPGVGKIAFTGSTTTGKKIMASAASTLKRLTLELGGNDAGILLEDVDVSGVAEDLFWAAFSNCGQVCAGLKRLYVPASIYDQVCAALVNVAKRVVVGDGRVPQVQMGPIQNHRQYRKIAEYVSDAVAHGARILLGGAPDKETVGNFYPVTILRDAYDGMAVVDEEQFGPVLPIVKYDKLADAIESANRSPYGLGGSVWSRDLEKAAEVVAMLECGSAWVNQHPSMGPQIPFGGVKNSGLGVELSKYGLEAYTDMFVVNVKKNQDLR